MLFAQQRMVSGVITRDDCADAASWIVDGALKHDIVITGVVNARTIPWFPSKPKVQLKLNHSDLTVSSSSSPASSSSSSSINNDYIVVSVSKINN